MYENQFSLYEKEFADDLSKLDFWTLSTAKNGEPTASENGKYRIASGIQAIARRIYVIHFFAAESPPDAVFCKFSPVKRQTVSETSLFYQGSVFLCHASQV